MKSIIGVGLVLVIFAVALWVWPGFLASRGEGDSGEAFFATARIARRDIGSTVLATGVIRPRVGAEVQVGSRVSGILQRLNVSIGDEVRAGQVLAELDDLEYQARYDQALAALERARVDAHFATLDRDRARELRYLEQQGGAESAAQRETLLELEQSLQDEDQDRVLLLTPETLQLAFLAAVLNQSAEDLKASGDESAFVKQLRERVESADTGANSDNEQENRLRNLLTQVDWLWPVTLAWRLDLDLDRFEREKSLGLLRDLYELSTSVVGEPEPSKHRTLYIDLNHDEEAGRGIDRLRELLGGRNARPYELFHKLLSYRSRGLLDQLGIALRKTEPADILLFEELSDGEQMFLGRMALFHLLEGEDDALLLLDEPETHFNDKWKREIVDIIDGALGDTANDVLISTHSSITVSDVFSDEIIKFEKRDGEARVVPVGIPTFGADPSEIMINVFDVPDSIGSRALDWLNEQLEKEWTPEQKAELERVIRKIGPGLHRSELRTIWRKLNAAQD